MASALAAASSTAGPAVEAREKVKKGAPGVVIATRYLTGYGFTVEVRNGFLKYYMR